MKTKDRVKALLIKSPHLKDDDDKLLATFWYYELKDMKRNPESINGMNLLTLISEGRLTNSKLLFVCVESYKRNLKILEVKNIS